MTLAFAPPQSAWLRPAKAALLFPHAEDENPPHPSQVIRYLRIGIKLLSDDLRAKHGDYLKLCGSRSPQGWFTTAEDVAEFVSVLTMDRTRSQGGAAVSPGQVARVSRANAVAESLGL